MPGYKSFSVHLRERFGAKVRKIPLDAGFTCPNRDGVLSRAGCVFCNPAGSGSGLGSQGISLRDQWDHWRAHLRPKYNARLFLAYLQSFSNTHGPIARLASVLDEIRELEDIVGVSVGTRPDCLDRDKIRLLASQPLPELWLELGLQSASDETLRRLNRGHDVASFVRAATEVADAGLQVCAHVMAGLPGESREDFLRTVDLVSSLPVAGIKFHNLYVARDTPLAEAWRRGRFRPLARDQYLDWLEAGLARLRPGIIVHRLNADPAPGELLAPDWAADKTGFLADIRLRLERDKAVPE